jgi:hypothetical protein
MKSPDLVGETPFQAEHRFVVSLSGGDLGAAVSTANRVLRSASTAGGRHAIASGLPQGMAIDP